jgi:hypothetical protein
LLEIIGSFFTDDYLHIPSRRNRVSSWSSVSVS